MLLKGVMIDLWSYAELSKIAKHHGSPEKLIESIMNAGKKAGRVQMVPVVIGALGVGYAVREVVNYLKEKKAQSEKNFEEAKAEIIQGIKDYDAEHPEELQDSIKARSDD